MKDAGFRGNYFGTTTKDHLHMKKRGFVVPMREWLSCSSPSGAGYSWKMEEE